MSPESEIKVSAPGYFLNHLEKVSNRCKMRVEGNLQLESSRLNNSDFGTGDGVWLRIREDTPQSSGGCEAAIRLSLEDAERVLSSLLEIMHYTLPDVKKAMRELDK